MSLHVWNCRCGRRWFNLGRHLWDTASAFTTWCPGCRPDAVGAGQALADWRPL